MQCIPHFYSFSSAITSHAFDIASLENTENWPSHFLHHMQVPEELNCVSLPAVHYSMECWKPPAEKATLSILSLLASGLLMSKQLYSHFLRFFPELDKELFSDGGPKLFQGSRLVLYTEALNSISTQM